MAKKINNLVTTPAYLYKDETDLLAFGAMLSKQQLVLNSRNINDYEFKIFSQWGDDGIIQYLIKNVIIENETFIEFGVENYQESNGHVNFFLTPENNTKSQERGIASY